MDNRQRGKRSKYVGGLFERMIEASCEYYREKGIAIIEKTPEPMKPITGMDRNGCFKAVFVKAAQPDFKGVLLNGKAIVFEAKHTDGETIKESRVTGEQAETLSEYERMGAECFVLVSFGFDGFYKIPWCMWRNMKEMFGKKSISAKDVESCKVKEGNGRIYFLGECDDGMVYDLGWEDR